MCALIDDLATPKTLNYSYPGWYYSWRRQGCAAGSQSDSFDIENMVYVLRVLLIHHSKQEIVFLHPDKSSSRHLPHTSLILCVCTGKTDTQIYSRFMLSASIIMKSVWMHLCMYRS